MTINQFKLYCIWFIGKYNGLCVKDVLKDCSLYVRHEKLLIDNIQFITEPNTMYMICKRGYTILRFQNSFEYLIKRRNIMKKYNTETLEDIV